MKKWRDSKSHEGYVPLLQNLKVITFGSFIFVSFVDNFTFTYCIKIVYYRPPSSPTKRKDSKGARVGPVKSESGDTGRVRRRHTVRRVPWSYLCKYSESWPGSSPGQGYRERGETLGSGQDKTKSATGNTERKWDVER